MSDLLNPTGEPFARVRLLKPGTNQTDKGPLVWNDRARKLVMSIYEQRGNLVLLDINHNMSEEAKAARLAAGITEEPHTAGYAGLEVDAAGALFMVPQYSEYARGKTRGGEIRYPSPEFVYDKKTREVLDIVRISLVHEPATWSARLVASATTRKWSKSMPPEMMAALMELAALLEKEQVSDAVKTKVAEVLGMANGGGAPASADLAAPTDPTPEKDKPLPMALKLGAAIDAVRAKRLGLENASLCEAQIERFSAELRRSGAKPLTPAEEKALLGYKDPTQLDSAIDLLKAGDRTKKIEISREPEKQASKVADAPKVGGYVEAVLSHFGVKPDGAA